MKKNNANFVPLTPLSFMRRTAAVYPDRDAIVYGAFRQTWSDSYKRCIRVASALAKLGISSGDTVAVMAPNIPPLFEAHFGVPMAGAVLNALNVRLDAAGIAYILQHSDARVLIVDTEFTELAQQALVDVEQDVVVVTIQDTYGPAPESDCELDYESFIESGDPDFSWRMPDDEWDSISINYTSGTTGKPKGVVYHHRGAYLNAIGNNLAWAMPHHPVYLWTLPMFHCNGWCFPWSITAMAGTHVCLRNVEAGAIYEALAAEQVTHLCGAPVVMNMLVNAPEEHRKPLQHKVRMMTAAAAPPAAILEKMDEAGFDVTHVYGLTEIYGPAVVCAWHEAWNDLPANEQARLKARQGVRYQVQEDLRVVDPDTMQSVPADGETIGELVTRGNIVMKGYLHDEQATADAFAGGFFHSGDLGVMHPDGYVEIKDRSKDIVISGGENISTIEVEGVLYRHPAVLEAAVVAQPDDHWGERPCAFVTLRPDIHATENEIISFCRDNLAHFKCPTRIVFGELPKTATGKIQKFKLRQLASD